MILYIIIALLGIIIGSFLNVCILRIPQGESIVFPASHCGTCGHDLRALELIPILSYFMLKGRCSHCKNKISWQYPLIEFTNGLLYVLVYYYFGNTLTSIAYAFFLSILLVIMVIDQRTMIIPNPLIIFGLGFALIYKIVLAVSILDINLFYEGIIGMLTGGLSIGIIMAFSFLIFKKEGMGMGDLKLLAMIGLFTSSRYVLFTLAIAILVGGIYGAYILVKKRESMIAFGPFLSIGAGVTIFWGDVLWRLYVNYMF